jgi:flavin-binding protein dodecin
MTGPFDTDPQARGGLGTRLLGRRARGAAAREIETLLAGSAELSTISAEDVAGIASSHGMEMSRLQSSCRDLYRRYLEFCLIDHALSDEEVADLAHLRDILSLSADAASEVHEEVACAVYGAAVDEVLSDHRLDPEEEVFLKRIRGDLNIDPEAARQAMDAGRRKARQRYLSSVVSSDDILVASQEIKLEIEGSSEESIEAAVTDALREATTVLPGLKRIEISGLQADVSNGGVGAWHVKLRAVLDRD